MDINVRNLTGSSASLAAKASETIGSLRRAVQDQWDTKCILRLHLRVRSIMNTLFRDFVALRHVIVSVCNKKIHLHMLAGCCTQGQDACLGTTFAVRRVPGASKVTFSGCLPPCQPCYFVMLITYNCRLLWRPRNLGKQSSPRWLSLQSRLWPLWLLLPSLQQQLQHPCSSP